MLPFTEKSSLKILHIRQSRSDFLHGVPPSWALKNHASEADLNKGTVSGTNSLAIETDWTDEEAVDRRLLRPAFAQFAEWIFGPKGIHSIQLVVFGDYAHGVKHPGNFILCRNMDDGIATHFRIIGKDHPEADVLNQYRDALEPCPMRPLC